MKQYDVVVIGGGSSGLAAAISAYEKGVKSILVLERDVELGGILNQCIHNGFGLHYFKEELTGPEYAQRFVHMLKDRNIDYKLGSMVLEITEEKHITYSSKEEGIVEVEATAIVLSTGCSERTRGAIQIPGVRKRGVFNAGTAQKYLNMDGYLVGKRVFILGSGDIGLIMARRMTLEGAKVLGVAEIMPFSNGLSRNIVQCLEDYDIPLYLSTTITNILGKEKVEQIELTQVDKNFQPIEGTSWTEDVDAVLLSVGLIPETNLLKQINAEMDPVTRGAVVNESMETSVEGVFACGNGLHVHDLVDFVTKESDKAGACAAEYVLNGKQDASEFLTKALNGISYTVPQRVRLDNIDKSLEVLFRVRQKYNNVKIQIKKDGVVIKEVKKSHLLPAEMESIRLKKEDLLGTKEELSLEVIV